MYFLYFVITYTVHSLEFYNTVNFVHFEIQSANNFAFILFKIGNGKQEEKFISL